MDAGITIETDGEAITMGTNVLQALSACNSIIVLSKRQDFSGVVHSVYDHALNFVDTRGQLYTIVPHTVDNGPQVIRVCWPEAFSFYRASVVPGSLVVSKGQSLMIANRIMVDMTRVSSWEGQLPVFPSREQRKTLRENLIVLRTIIGCHGIPGGLKELYGDNGLKVESSLFERELRSRALRLLKALRDVQYQAALNAGQSLLGFGLGSTPSGDDFLAGLITVWNMPEAPFGFYRDLGLELARRAKTSTTIVSQAMLDKAAHGRARARVINLLEALTSGTQRQTAQASNEILKIGSISGTDIAAGMVAGLELSLSIEEGKHGNESSSIN